MINTTKAELRKIFTVRSTLGFVLFSFGLTLIFAFWVDGYKASAGINDPQFFNREIVQAIGTLATFAGFIAVLLITHEYRHNTITYTITSARNRLHVIVSKFLALSLFSLLFSLLFGILTPLLIYAGTAAGGHHVASQNINVGYVLWHSLYGGWVIIMYGAIIALLIRAQVGAVVAFLIIPSTLEQILGVVLKKNVDYLPFRSVYNFMSTSGDEHIITASRAAMVAGIYVIVGWIIVTLLFLKRDAN